MRFTRRVLRVLRACAGSQQACTCQQPAVRCARCGSLHAADKAKPLVIGGLPAEGDASSRHVPVGVREWKNPSAPPPAALAARDAHLAQVAQARAYLSASARTRP